MKKSLYFTVIQSVNIVALGVDINDPKVKLQLGNSDIPTTFDKAMDGVLYEIYNPLISYYRDGSEYMDCAFRLREIGKHCILKRIDDLNNGREIPKDVLTLIISSTRIYNSYFMHDCISLFKIIYSRI
jgi:hypothetical protein